MTNASDFNVHVFFSFDIHVSWLFSDVLDNFLNLADLNNDGYLNYAEYAAAIKLGSSAIEEQNPEL